MIAKPDTRDARERLAERLEMALAVLRDLGDEAVLQWSGSAWVCVYCREISLAGRARQRHLPSCVVHRARAVLINERSERNESEEGGERDA